MLSAFAYMSLYILLFGVAALLEQPIARHLDAFQLDALLRIGAAAVALAVLLVLRGLALPGWAPALAGVGIGLISGSLCYCVALNRLPSDLAACLANGYLVVTVALGIVVLHEPLTVFTISGLALTIGGAIVLSLRSGKAPAADHESPAGGTRFALVAPQVSVPASPSPFRPVLAPAPAPLSSPSTAPSSAPAPASATSSASPIGLACSWATLPWWASGPSWRSPHSSNWLPCSSMPSRRWGWWLSDLARSASVAWTATTGAVLALCRRRDAYAGRLWASA